MPYWAADKGGAGGGSESDAGDDDEETPPENDDQDPEDDDEFDQERAMATIRNQRAAEKELKKQLKETAKKLQAFEDAEAERAKAEMGELERAQSELAGLQEQYAETTATLNEYRLERAFGRVAAQEELAFANHQAREDAFALLDLSEVTINGEGAVDEKAMKKAVGDLKKSRPYLFVAEDDSGGLGTPPRGRTRLPAPKKPGLDDAPSRPLVQF